MEIKFIKKPVLCAAMILIFMFHGFSLFTVQAEQKGINIKKTPSGIMYRDIRERTEQFIEERKEGCASVSVSIFEHDNTLCSIQYGFSDMENQIYANEDTVYEWGSVSKLLVWTSVMQLYEQGLIDLNKDIREYLPDDFLTKLSYNEPITMLNLMNHNAGWQETTYDTEVKDMQDIVDLETTLKITQPPQIYIPGKVTAYSNWGTALAAYIVENVSGSDYTEYVHQNILDPLGMKRTSVGADYQDNKWVAEKRKELKCYSILKDHKESYGNNIRYILLYPAGSAAGTADDLAVFAKAFVPQEGTQCPLFQNKETLDQMMEATSYYGDSDIARNCHGFWTLQYTEDIMGHNGNTSGCTSTLMFQPESGLGVIIMTNEAGETAFNYGILSLLYGDYSENQQIKDADIPLQKDLSGIYTSSRSYEKGFSAIYKYMGSLMPIQRDRQENIYKLAIGQGSLKNVSGRQYIMDNENGWRYLMYETEDDNGNTVFQMMSADVIKENSLIFGLNAASAVIFLLCILGSVLILLTELTAFIKRRLVAKDMQVSKKSGIICCLIALSNCFVGILFYNLILAPLDSGSVRHITAMLECIFISAAALFNIISAAVMFINFKKDSGVIKCRKRYKIIAVIGCYVSCFIIYWQLYNFWSC